MTHKPLSERKGRKVFKEPETAKVLTFNLQDGTIAQSAVPRTPIYEAKLYDVPARIIREKDWQRIMRLLKATRPQKKVRK